MPSLEFLLLACVMISNKTCIRAETGLGHVCLGPSDPDYTLTVQLEYFDLVAHLQSMYIELLFSYRFINSRVPFFMQ